MLEKDQISVVRDTDLFAFSGRSVAVGLDAIRSEARSRYAARVDLDDKNVLEFVRILGDHICRRGGKSDIFAVSGDRGRDHAARTFIALILITAKRGLADALQLRRPADPDIDVPEVVLVFFRQRKIIVKCDSRTVFGDRRARTAAACFADCRDAAAVGIPNKNVADAVRINWDKIGRVRFESDRTAVCLDRRSVTVLIALDAVHSLADKPSFAGLHIAPNDLTVFSAAAAQTLCVGHIGDITPLISTGSADNRRKRLKESSDYLVVRTAGDEIEVRRIYRRLWSRYRRWCRISTTNCSAAVGVDSEACARYTAFGICHFALPRTA